MLIIEAATFAGLIILLVQFANIMTKVRLAIDDRIRGHAIIMNSQMFLVSKVNTTRQLYGSGLCRMAAHIASTLQLCTNGMLPLAAFVWQSSLACYAAMYGVSFRHIGIKKCCKSTSGCSLHDSAASLCVDLSPGNALHMARGVKAALNIDAIKSAVLYNLCVSHTVKSGLCNI